MAKQLGRQLLSYVLVFLLLLLLLSSEMAMVEAKLCDKRRKTWSGFCANFGNCRHQCRNLERAQQELFTTNYQDLLASVTSNVDPSFMQ